MRLSGAALSFVSLLSVQPVLAATVSVVDLTATQVTETTQAASAGVSVLTAFAKTKTDSSRLVIAEVRAETTALQTTITQMKSILAELEARTDKSSTRQQKILALREKLGALEQSASNIQALKEESAARYEAAMRAAVSSLSTAIVASQAVTADATGAFIESQIAEIEKLNESLRKLTEKIKETQAKMERLMPKLLADLGQKEDAQKAIVWFTRVSTDRDQAARVLAAALSNVNNASALGQFLNTDSPGSNFEVREVRDLSGILVLFRLGRLTHCFSPKLQCGGRPYSVTP